MVQFLICALFLLGIGTGSADPIPSFKIVDLDGKEKLIGGKDSKATNVFVFILHDCPISNQYQPALSRLAERFAPYQFQFHLIHADPKATQASAKKHADEFNIESPVYLDPVHRVVRRLEATTTPEVVVLNPFNEVVYQGRIDNLYFKLGRKRFKATRHDLRDTLQAMVDGLPISHAKTKAIGCYIPPLDSN